MRIRSTIIVNVATVLVFAGVAAICIKEVYLHSGPPRASESSNARIVVGELLPPVAKYDWHSHRQTLLLALRDGCHYCERSAPFYRRLAALESSGVFRNVHILAVFPDGAGIVSKVLESEQLRVESVSSVDFHVLGVSGTPTAVLVDQAGKVLDVWRGELDASREQTPIDRLRSAT